MTEDEAKTKWCPFARVGAADHEAHRNPPYVVEGIALNRVETRDQIGLPAGSLCVASTCMAWRWLPETEWVLADPNEPAPVRGGYCGLAGASR